VWAYEIGRAGLLAAPFFLATGLMGPVAGRLADYVGPRPVAASGGALWTAAIVVLWLVLGDEPNVALWLVVVLTGGIGSGLFWGSAPTLALEELDGPEFPRPSGINQTMQNVGNALAIAIAITLLGNDPTLNDFTPVFAMVVLVGAMSAAIAWSGGRRTRRPVETVDLVSPR